MLMTRRRIHGGSNEPSHPSPQPSPQLTSSNPTCRPGSLKIESARDPVDVEQFTGEIKAGTNAAFHGFEIHFTQTHPAAGDEFLFVQAFAGNKEFRANELLDEVVPGTSGEIG